MFFSFHMTSVAWLFCWGGALCRTHLSGVTGDYDWIATCRAPEVIQSSALISTMTVVALHPTQPPLRPQLFSWPPALRCLCSVWHCCCGATCSYSQNQKPATIFHTHLVYVPDGNECVTGKSTSDTYMFSSCCTQLAKKSGNL